MMTFGILLLAAGTTALPPVKADTQPQPAQDLPPIKTVELRNPFWPTERFNEYIDDIEAITSEPVVKIVSESEASQTKTAADAAAEVAAREAAAQAKLNSSKEISRQTWAKAAATTLKITGIMIGEESTSYRINGRIYSYGNNISTDYNGHRFTWCIKPGESPRKPRFEQIRVIEIPTKNEEPSNQREQK